LSSKLIWVVAVVNTAGALVLAFVRSAMPSSKFWDEHPNWIMAALCVTVAVPLTQAAVIEMGERGRRKKVEREQKIQTFLAASLIYLAHQGKADWENTGIQVFAVTGVWHWQRQVRVTKFRLRAVTTSGVRWTKGKGVIGRCWEVRQPLYVNVAEDFAPYAHYDRVQWEELPATARYGLTFEDYKVVKGKYGVIAAVPMIDPKNDRYIGCVTADMPPLPAGATEPVQDEVLKSLALTASNVVHVL
jgi:hypothetical protein